jgi:aryl-alcohol dehydrogenase-like predicted oxidoreductase
MTTLRKLGTSDLEVYPLNLGGNVFGWTADRDQSFAVLDAYAAAGGNFLDTADAYSSWLPGHRGGESETIIGEWIAARGNRASMVVATKGSRHPEFEGLDRATLTAALEASLRRLGTDYIDLYYTHFDDESVPIADIVATLDGFVRAGKVRAVAASNISAARLAAALEFAEREGLAGYVAVQPRYNLVARDSYEGALTRVVERNGLAALPYHSLAAGFLTGKYRPGVVVDSARAARGAAAHLDTPRGRAVLAALDVVAAAHDTEVATVALAWLAAQPTIAAPIASARVVDQLPALLAAGQLRLGADELAALTAASQ